MAQSDSIQTKSDLQDRIDALYSEHMRDALAWLNLPAEGSITEVLSQLHM